MSAAASKGSILQPTEVREFPLGKIEIVDLGTFEFIRTIFQPGWKWSECVKPIAGTDSCQVPHRMYLAAGSMDICFDDGTEVHMVAGDVGDVPAGHDAWVVGDETVVAYDFGGEDVGYAKPAP